jgi:hypothetical protein
VRDLGGKAGWKRLVGSAVKFFGWLLPHIHRNREISGGAENISD